MTHSRGYSLRWYALVAATVWSCLTPMRLFAGELSFADSWRWVKFGVDVGLPSTRVLALVEARDGITWVRTEEAVAWYNGFAWREVTASQGLPRGSATWMMPDSGGTMFVVIAGRLYRGDSGGFRLTPVAYNGQELPVLAAVRTEEGVIIETLGADGQKHLFLHRTSGLVPLPLPSQIVLDETPGIFLTQSGRLWVNTLGGVYCREAAAWRAKIVFPGKFFHVNQIIEDEHGTGIASMFSPNETRGLWEWQRSKTPVYNRAEGKDLIQSMDIGPSGEAVAVYMSGDVRVRQGGVWSSLVPLPTELRSVLFVRFNSAGDLWVGTDDGLLLYKRSSTRWSYWKYPFPDPRNTVFEVLRVKDGSIWVGVLNGIEIHHPNGRTESITRINGQPIEEVTGLGEDAQGNVWISSGSSIEGAFRWDGHTWKYFGERDGLAAARYHRIRKDGQGNLWFLGLGKDRSLPKEEPGAFRLRDGRFERWDVARGLLSGRVYSFAEGMNKDLWFGTLKGICRWQDGGWRHWTSREGLRYERITSLAVDHDGRLWFGDEKNGLGSIGADGVPRYLGTGDGLPGDEVTDVKPDSSGRLWVSTRGGIAMLADGGWTVFDFERGIHSLRLWSILPTRDHLYIATEGAGVNILNFGESRDPSPRVEILDPIVEEDAVLFRWKPFAWQGETSSANIETRYQIDGRSWSDWERRRELLVKDLNTGTHSFRVQARGVFGGFDQEGSAVFVTVDPPLLLRPLVMVPGILLVLAITLMLVILAVRKRRHALALRQSEERHRLLFENGPVPMYIFEIGTYRILGVNKAAVEKYGYTRDELLTMSIVQLRPPEDVDVFMRDVAEIGARGRRGVFRHRKKDGAIFPVEITVHDLAFNGRPARLVMAFDVTDRERAAAALRESEEVARALLNARMDSALLITADGVILAANGPATLRLGMATEPVVGKTLEDIFDPSVALGRRLHIAEVAKSGNPAHFQDVRNGRVFRSSLYPVRNAQGVVDRVAVYAQDVTDQLLVEGKLRTSEERYRSVYERSPLAFVLWDTTCSVIDWNRQAEVMFGWSKDEIIGKDFPSLLYPPFEQKQIREQARKLILGGEHYSSVDHNLRKDGTVILCEWHNTLLHDSDGQPMGVISLGLDITERQRTENLLKESERKYRSVVENTTDAIYVVNNDGVFLMVNKAASIFTNGNAEVTAGASLRDIFPPEIAEERIRTIRDVIATGKGYTEETATVIDGRTVWMSTKLEPVRNASGAVVAAQGFSRDITDRKEAERALHESESKYRELVERMGEGLLVVDNDDVIQFANPCLCRLFGYEAEELLGRVGYEVLGDGEAGQIIADKNRDRLAGISDSYEVPMRKKSGESILVRITGAPLTDAHGKVVGSLGILADITERKKIEESIKSALEEKTVLLKEIHHRVKNNLQVISSLLNLQSHQIKDPKSLEIFKDSQHRVRSMALVHEKLYQSHSLSRIDFGEYIRSLSINLFRSYGGEERGITLSVDIQDIFLGVDTAIPCGLLVNELVSNSLKHAFPPGWEGGRTKAEPPSITVALHRGGEKEIQLCVTDNGVGFPPSMDFRHTESLGMQLILTLTDQLSGRVELCADHGTAFTIVFPYQQLEGPTS